MIVAISGKMRSGKDTVADILVAKRHFHKIALADVLRRILLSTDPWIAVDDETPPVRLSEIIKHTSWEHFKDEWPEEYRHLVTGMGNDGLCSIDDCFFINAALERIQTHPTWDWVISDIRTDAEYWGALNFGAKMWRVLRPDTDGGAGSHTTETAIDGYKFGVHVHNEGSLEDLEKQVLSKLDVSRNKTCPF